MPQLHQLRYTISFTHCLFGNYSHRARAKSGLKILGATASSDVWNVSYEKENAKQTVARVTVFRNEQSDVEVTEKPDANNDTDENR